VRKGPCLGLATFFAFHSNRHEHPALPCKRDDITYLTPPHRSTLPPQIQNGRHALHKPQANPRTIMSTYLFLYIFQANIAGK
jgi:hypothetical protein